MITIERDSNSQLGQRLLEPVASFLPWYVLNHCFDLFRSSLRLVIPITVVSSTAEKSNAIHG